MQNSFSPAAWGPAVLLQLVLLSLALCWQLRPWFLTSKSSWSCCILSTEALLFSNQSVNWTHPRLVGVIGNCGAANTDGFGMELLPFKNTLLPLNQQIINNEQCPFLCVNLRPSIGVNLNAGLARGCWMLEPGLFAGLVASGAWFVCRLKQFVT